MRFGKRRQGVARTDEIGGQDVEPIAHLKDECRVDRVLTGCAPVHVRPGLDRHLGDELLNERDDECASVESVALERCQVEQFDAACLGDRACRLVRDEAGARFGAREVCLEAEDVTDMGLSTEDPIDRRSVHRAGDLKSKKTVSPAPCSTMSNRYSGVRLSSGARLAIRVGRRACGTRRRMGSVSVDGSSSKYIRVSRWFMSPRAKTAMER